MNLPPPGLPQKGEESTDSIEKTYDEAVDSPLLLGERPGGVGILERGQGVRVSLKILVKVVFHGFIFFSVMLLPPPSLPPKGEEYTDSIERNE